MNAIIELLPLVFGLLAALFFRFTNSFQYKNVSCVLLSVALGFLANRINGEGNELLIVDILTTSGSTVVFIFLIRYYKRIRG